MNFRIILLKEYHQESEYYQIKDMIGFENKEDLENFKNQNFSLVFRFRLETSEEKVEATKEKIKLKIYGQEIIPTIEIKRAKDTHLESYKDILFEFQVPAQKISNLIDKGCFYIAKNIEASKKDLTFSLKDHKHKETFLSRIILRLPHIMAGISHEHEYRLEHSDRLIGMRFYANFPSKDIRGPGYMYVDRYRDYLFYPDEHLHSPPGTIDTFGIYWENQLYSEDLPWVDQDQKFSLTIKNFQPEEHIAFVSWTIDSDKISSYALIPPSVIKQQLASNNKIDFVCISNQLAPAYCHGDFLDIPRENGKPYNWGEKEELRAHYFDKLVLPLPSLFAASSDLEIMTTMKYSTFKKYYGFNSDYEYKEIDAKEEKKVKYFQNPAKFFEIYIDEAAQTAWLEHQQRQGIKDVRQLKRQAKEIHSYVTQTEHHPLRFRHDPEKDILSENTITRHIYDDEHVIHLMPHTHDVPQPISFHDALPEVLQRKFQDRQFCLIQYNGSQTVPDKNKAGYSSFKDQKLEPGRIHRDFLSIENLKTTKLHPEYGGSYYVLAACTKDYMQNRNTKDKPELWTIYTEGKEWRTLKDDKGKALAYPYKINY